MDKPFRPELGEQRAKAFVHNEPLLNIVEALLYVGDCIKAQAEVAAAAQAWDCEPIGYRMAQEPAAAARDVERAESIIGTAIGPRLEQELRERVRSHTMAAPTDEGLLAAICDRLTLEALPTGSLGWMRILDVAVMCDSPRAADRGLNITVKLAWPLERYGGGCISIEDMRRTIMGVIGELVPFTMRPPAISVEPARP